MYLQCFLEIIHYPSFSDLAGYIEVVQNKVTINNLGPEDVVDESQLVKDTAFAICQLLLSAERRLIPDGLKLAYSKLILAKLNFIM